MVQYYHMRMLCKDLVDPADQGVEPRPLPEHVSRRRVSLDENRRTEYVRGEKVTSVGERRQHREAAIDMT
jgi:hypothetical protein